MKLESLLAAITPLPWKLSGNSIVTEEHCIAVIEDDGGYEAKERTENGKYLVNAANVLPELFSASNEYLAEHLRNGMVKAKTIARLQAAIMAAEEVKDA